MSNPYMSHSTNCSLEQLYAMATGPENPDFRAAFIRQYKEGNLLSERIRQLTARIAELEAAADPMAVIIAVVAELAKLTGESCHVECSVWYHPGTANPVSAKWRAYRSGQVSASYTGQTCEEATAKVRADWAQHRPGAEVAAPTTEVMPY